MSQRYKHSPQLCWQYPLSPNVQAIFRGGKDITTWHANASDRGFLVSFCFPSDRGFLTQKHHGEECSKLLSKPSKKRNEDLLVKNADAGAHPRPTESEFAFSQGPWEIHIQNKFEKH